MFAGLVVVFCVCFCFLLFFGCADVSRSLPPSSIHPSFDRTHLSCLHDEISPKKDVLGMKDQDAGLLKILGPLAGDAIRLSGYDRNGVSVALNPVKSRISEV